MSGVKKLRMIVFDSSALLALARRESGAQVVSQNLSSGHVSAVNASEFVQKLNQYGDDGERAFRALTGLGLTLHEVGWPDASAAAAIYDVGKAFGLSIGDRMCLALAQRLKADVYTADVVWLNVAEALRLNVYAVR